MSWRIYDLVIYPHKRNWVNRFTVEYTQYHSYYFLGVVADWAVDAQNPLSCYERCIHEHTDERYVKCNILRFRHLRRLLVAALPGKLLTSYGLPYWRDLHTLDKYTRVAIMRRYKDDVIDDFLASAGVDIFGGISNFHSKHSRLRTTHQGTKSEESCNLLSGFVSTPPIFSIWKWYFLSQIFVYIA